MTDKPDVHEDEHEVIIPGVRGIKAFPPSEDRVVVEVREVGSLRDGADAEFHRIFDYKLWAQRERPIVWPVGAMIPIKDEEVDDGAHQKSKA